MNNNSNPTQNSQFSEKIEKRLNSWKQKLIDLTKRNRLLNFKESKTSTVKIIDEIPTEVFKMIHIEGNTFNFLSFPDKDDENKLFDVDKAPNIKLESTQFSKYDPDSIEEKHSDLNLQTGLKFKDLIKKLKRIEFQAKQVMEEHGYNVLFLALGFLKWYEDDNSEAPLLSPLVMLPVELYKKTINSDYQLRCIDEEAFINPAIQYKLKTDFQISLEDISENIEDFDPISYFSSINRLIEKRDRWSLQNDIYLSLFSFAKFSMYRDIEAHRDKYSSNMIIKKIIGEAVQLNKDIDPVPANEIDEKCPPQQIFQVLDADSSQQEAIEAVKSGANIVIQGPPGTGKSQTITNIIGESLAQGKKVLFVSEKMAALDVVYNRLDDVGLATNCLEIHSHKASKMHIYKQLKNAYELANPGKPKDTKLFAELTEKKKNNNLYVNTLHKTFEPFGVTVYWIIGHLNNLKEIELIQFDLKELKNISYQELAEKLLILSSVEKRVSLIGHPYKHPFWGCDLHRINEFELDKLKSIITGSISKFKKTSQLKEEIETFIKLSFKNIYELNRFKERIVALTDSHQIESALVNVNDIENNKDKILDSLSEIEHYNAEYQEILDCFKAEFFQEDISKILEDLKTKYSNGLRLVKPGYYQIKKIIKLQAKSTMKLKYDEIVELFEKTSSNLIELNSIREKFNLLKPMLDSLWDSENTDTAEVRKQLSWIDKYRSDYGYEYEYEKELHKYLVSNTNISESLLKNIDSFETAFGEINSLIKQMDHILKFDKNTISKRLGVDEENNIENIFQMAVIETINVLLKEFVNNLDTVIDWTRYNRAFDKCKEHKLDNYIHFYFSRKDNNLNEIVDQFKKAVLYQWFDEIKTNNPILNNFESHLHEKNIKEFQETDRNHINLSRALVRYDIFQKTPKTSWEPSSSSELGILLKQFRLKRRHMPVRKLFQKIPNIVLDITPCLMMSPLSLSLYIDPGKIEFDLVVFDEASQISPEDSIGAIVRGKQIVVAGDTEQMPPTNFFSSILSYDEDNNDDEYEAPDLESILDECLTMGIPQYTLKWHYRSKHESLISFSNKYIYNGKLLTFPSPEFGTNHSGVSLVYTPENTYDRGGSGTNFKEAELVAKEIYRHYKVAPNKSLGVVAFSQKQQRLIIDVLEQMRRNDTSLESIIEATEEKLFIKNLETVQGDERDVIFISIGFGKDKHGRFSMNFGPLNKVGGERRLNVLVTRARQQVKVFSSINGHDFDLSKTQSQGVRLLKQYLDYAESGGDDDLLEYDMDLSHKFDEDNIFEKSVYDQLQKLHIKCIPQVGCSGYKIDFGILNPDNPSEFILALECDGASYHSSHTARDRDRLRQEVLERLGWKFHRIWSTDWFLNPKREMDKLLQAIKNAKNISGQKEKLNKEVIEIGTELVFDEPKQMNNGVKTIDYERFHLNETKKQEDFYNAMEWGNNNSIPSYILKILEVENPIHIKELSTRVINIYGITKVGSRILKFMTKEVKKLHQNNSLILKSDFIYNPDCEITVIRKRSNEDAVKNIEYVAPEEIELAINTVLAHEKTIDFEPLLQHIAMIFGFQRTGPKFKEYVGEIIRKMELVKKNVK